MKRTKLKDRSLPGYSRREELFHMISHIVGGALGVIACCTCVIKAFLHGGAYEITAAFLYGLSMILLYTMSSIYHGLRDGTAKKVLQIMDHCSIFLLIAGTYTPVSLVSLRRLSPALGWSVFAIVWGLSILGTTFNAIDLKKYSKLSMILYLLLGWCIILTGPSAIRAMGMPCLMLMLAGGISYTLGAIFYAVGGKGAKPLPYMHGVFHIFVVLGSLLHYLAILLHIL